MTSRLAFAAVTRTVLHLLDELCPRDGSSTTPDFNLYQGHDFAEGTTARTPEAPDRWHRHHSQAALINLSQGVHDARSP